MRVMVIGVHSPDEFNQSDYTVCIVMVHPKAMWPLLVKHSDVHKSSLSSLFVIKTVIGGNFPLWYIHVRPCDLLCYECATQSAVVAASKDLLEVGRIHILRWNSLKKSRFPPERIHLLKSPSIRMCEGEIVIQWDGRTDTPSYMPRVREIVTFGNWSVWRRGGSRGGR